MNTVQGECDDRFVTVSETLAGLLETKDLGASVAVSLDGELVVDLWGGYADAARTRAWECDTLVNVWSTSKTLTSLCALVLADRGEIDPYAPVAKYWPEFAAGGKDGVEVRHLLSHTAGVPGWDTPITLEDLYDWDTCTGLLAAQAPWWQPGTSSGYHAVTQGYLVGEVVRRVTGQSLGTFLREQVTEPLGTDFHIGLPATEDDRVAELVITGTLGAPPATDGGDPEIQKRVSTNPPAGGLLAATRTRAWRAAESPSINGHGNARSVALTLSVLACGGSAGGTRLLSEQGCATVFEEQSDGVDKVLGVPVRFGMGYGLADSHTPILPNPRTCFWGGAGGSLAVVDFDARMVVTYVMNRMVSDGTSGTLGDARAQSIVTAVYQALAR
ncbi:serine hydrolase domain-containing protein [Amycolatopsis sp. NPDC059021]|uniref:serine hydrolase domain-containing protein n=1 Tax=Amycolatopsis sp. NPDC059021 TaxID=3346704 RepID=UPI0036717411